MSGGSPSGGHGRWGRPAGVLLVVLGLIAAAAALRPEGGLLGTPTTGPVANLGYVVLLGLVFAGLVGRFAARYREEVRHLDGPTPRAERLRAVAIRLLPLAAGAVPVLLLVLHTRAGKPSVRFEPPVVTPMSFPPGLPQAPPVTVPEGGGVGVGAVVVGLLAVVAVAALLIGLVLLLRKRRGRVPLLPAAPPLAVVPARPEEALAEAVASGRRALTGDDARAAVIACYAAMEGSLAESGLPRQAWESPTELLHRVLSDGRVDAAAARELTALFREARYSTHPMDDEQVRRARAALDAIAARLAEAGPPAEDGLPAQAGAQTGGGAR
ncbi:DUF4129 domain-containing protein [Kitasatospora sp. NPDC096077]|uniref:DUF4129 domain-containing protein n=1 Tax=Kitasatospora sp. NPDC096077 TaxID=3155544 RepID=UPI0033177EF2